MMTVTPPWRRLITAALLLAAVIPMAGADHDRVRKLHQSQDIVGLEQILTTFRDHYPDGRVLEVELECKDGQHIYELEILDSSGKVRELRFDAVSGGLLNEGD
ncbi:PepSY domain-containing protein [Halomonadaceae bacterium KBTZ08]